MSILDKIPSLAENELFQKLAAIEDITALCKEDQEKYDGKRLRIYTLPFIVKVLTFAP